MSFVKSILQQWRDRNLKKNAAPGHEPLSPADIPGNDIAEQHLLEALARQINDAVANGETITSLNIETTYEQLAESLDRFKQESLNVARNEVSEQWSEEESRRIAEIKNLQQQNAELLQNFTESQKRYAGADRLRKTLSERIHDLENELVTVRNEYEREIEEKLRQINQIKARSLGLSHESDEAPADNEPHEENKTPLRIALHQTQQSAKCLTGTTQRKPQPVEARLPAPPTHRRIGGRQPVPAQRGATSWRRTRTSPRKDREKNRDTHHRRKYPQPTPDNARSHLAAIRRGVDRQLTIPLRGKIFLTQAFPKNTLHRKEKSNRTIATNRTNNKGERYPTLPIISSAIWATMTKHHLMSNAPR